MKKNVLFVLLDDFADWEGAFLAAALRTRVLPNRPTAYDVKYLTPDGKTVCSLGGVRVTPDYDISTLPTDCAGLILVGGLHWQSEEALRIVPLVEKALARRILVGAICSAMLFLGAHGFLNDVRHTGNTLEMMKQWGGTHYTGDALYEERQVVSDRNVVTANGSSYLEFTGACLLGLEVDTPKNIEASFSFNKHGFYKA